REEDESVELYSLLGTLETDERVWNVESSELFWSRGADEFLFPRGFTAYDTEFILTADVASIDRNGVVLLDRGGVIRWTQNEK
ncbi:MAG: hypothetical protein LBT65_08940, partial [Synergistaceae bacterium]|nr:hypothetical protein [Synergistaceae bacterium]